MNETRTVSGHTSIEASATEGDVPPNCPTCLDEMHWNECDQCDEGIAPFHECGEDTCCCLHPDYNVTCSTCDGHGGWWACWNKHSEVRP